MSRILHKFRHGHIKNHKKVIVSFTSPYGKFYFSKTLCQSRLALPLPKNSNPSSFPLSIVLYAVFLWVFLSCVFLPEPMSVQLLGGNCYPFAAYAQFMSITFSFTCSLIVSMLALLRTSSLDTRIGQHIFFKAYAGSYVRKYLV